MQGQPVERMTKPTRSRSAEELETLRHRKGKHNKNARGGRHEWTAD